MASDNGMRVGIDLYAFNPASSDGVSTFALGLVGGLLANTLPSKQLVLLVSQANELFFKKLFVGRNVKIFRVPVPRFARYLNRIIWILSWLVREYRLRYWYEQWFRRGLTRRIEAEVDALIVPTTVFNFFALRVSTILCIHDIQHEYHPENFTLHQRMLRWASYRLSCSRATAIQVSSLYIQDCLLEKFMFLAQHRFLVAPEGVDTNRFSEEAEDQIPQELPAVARQGFVFYPAQIWKHKNHALLMHALAEFRARMGFEIPCVLTGHDYGYWPELENIRRTLGLRSVFYLGRVEFAELLWLYKNCSAVLALGLHESSSLPVREGAAFGKPLLCTDILPNVESAEYLHLHLFRQDSAEALADLLVTVHEGTDNIREWSAQNKTAIAALRWHVIARKYVDRLAENFHGCGTSAT
ncbi:MAG TPA: glycosyltransferase [Rhodocyclaceae bacterium]|jgi:glycosyltransferase involved in cell wall biosynthesis